MGEFLDRVTARRDTAVALAHRVALLIDKTGRKAIIVEAGDDVFMYTAFLRRLGCAGRADLYAAAGRDKVIQAVCALLDLGKASHAYGIVDRDFHFQDPTTILDGHCFVLDRYSIENLFIEADVLKEVGESFFALDPDGEDRESWECHVRNFLETLDQSLLDQHAIGALCAKRKSNCNMGNFDVLQVTVAEHGGRFTVNDNALSEFIRLAQVDYETFPTEDIDHTLDQLACRGAKNYFRGHYFWALFVRMLNLFRTHLDQRNKERRISRARTRATINDRHAFEAATPFVQIPECLEHFLKGSM